MSMKRTLIHIVLCLSLILCLATGASASTLDTTAITIEGNTVTVAASSNEVLTALHSAGKTARLAVPTDFETGATVHVMKDETTVVAHSWVDGMVQFEVPGAGVYKILAGEAPEPPATDPTEPSTEPTEPSTAPTEPEVPALDEVLENIPADNTTVTLAGDSELNKSCNVAPGTVIEVGGNSIKAPSGKSSTLTADGAFTLKEINGVKEIRLDKGDSITFSANGSAVITAAMDYNRAGQPVGYGKFQITTMSSGTPITRTYFLAAGETVTVLYNGTVSSRGAFAPGNADAQTPVYQIVFDSHNNSHRLNSGKNIVVRCNGLYEYYTGIYLIRQGSSTETLLASRENGRDVLHVSGIGVSRSSTALTLTNSYLNTLPTGTHTLRFYYNDGSYAESKIHVNNIIHVADKTNPKTGDSSLIAAPVLFFSFAGLAVLTVNKRKKFL